VHVDPLVEALLSATVAIVLLIVALNLLFWLVMGGPPSLGIVIGELIGLGMGVPLLAITSPRRRH
jgi:hypothetical protein